VCFKSRSMFQLAVLGTKYEACHAANDITMKIEEHVPRKGVANV